MDDAAKQRLEKEKIKSNEEFLCRISDHHKFKKKNFAEGGLNKGQGS